jgi:hypothetical protein
MKSILTILLLLLVCLNLNAQSAEWTKADRNVLFDEYNSFLVQYKNLSQEQRESLSLCCLDETTKGFSKAEYNAKIDIEIKRSKEATIIQCAKNMGIELKKTETEIEKVVAPVEPTSWTKEDKSKLAKLANEYLEDYEYISTTDKEKIILCYIEDITTKNTKEEYDLLIDIELRQLKSTTISKCAKKLSISMEAPLKIEPKVEVKVEKSLREQIVGTWRTDQGYTIQFKDDGSFIKTFHNRIEVSGFELTSPAYFVYITNNTTLGTWFIDGQIITLDEQIKAEWEYTSRRYSEMKYADYTAKTVWTVGEVNDKFLKLQYVSGFHCCKDRNAQSKTTSVLMGNKQ